MSELLDALRRKIAKRLSPNPTVDLFRRIKQFDLTPNHIVDIGANHGNWTRFAINAFPNARVTLFEPQKNLAASHSDLAANPNIDIHYKGVGSHDGTAPFVFHDRDDSSTFSLDTETAEKRGYMTGEVEICRLDTFIADSPYGSPEIVKIDAEGFDLEVIEGGSETIKAATVVLVEASIANRDYPNSIVEVVNAMRRLDMRLWDITDLNRTPERDLLWLVEGVFVRSGSTLDIEGSTFR